MMAITEFETRAQARAALHAVDHSAMDLPVRKYELEAGLDLAVQESDAADAATTADWEVVTVDDGRYLGFVTPTLQFMVPDPAQVLCREIAVVPRYVSSRSRKPKDGDGVVVVLFDFDVGGGGGDGDGGSIGVFGSTAIAICELWRRTFQRVGARHATSAVLTIHFAGWLKVGGGSKDLVLPISADRLLYDPDNDNFDSWEGYHVWFMHTVRAMLEYPLAQTMDTGDDMAKPPSGSAWMEVTYDDSTDRNMRASVKLVPDRAVPTCRAHGRTSFVCTVPFNRAVTFAYGGEGEDF